MKIIGLAIMAGVVLALFSGKLPMDFTGIAIMFVGIAVGLAVASSSK